MLNKNKEGSVFDTNYGTLKIIKYNGWDDVRVKFLSTGFIKSTCMSSIKSGKVKDPMVPSVLGVGITGDVVTGSDKAYPVWTNMLSRCYSEEYQKREPTYIGCEVCKEWLYFPTFSEWFHEHYREGFQLDKDILVKGNKLYSPATCVFLPSQVNSLLTDRGMHRGEFPKGVYFVEDKVKYRAQINKEGKRYNLGMYDTPEEAFSVYKKEKEDHIHYMAAKYFKEELITEKVYQALLEVNITK